MRVRRRLTAYRAAHGLRPIFPSWWTGALSGAKLARYDAFLTDGWRRTRHARCRHEPAVLFVIRDEQHLGAAIREADRHLTAWVGSSAGRLEHGRFPGREEIGFTTRERLMTTDSAVLQVAPQPPARPRRAHVEVPTIETALELSALFAPDENSDSATTRSI